MSFYNFDVNINTINVTVYIFILRNYLFSYISQTP